MSKTHPMKPLPFSALLPGLLLVLPPTLTAGPLPAAKVPADAKWVLHLDADKLQTTQVGTHFLREVLDPKSAKGKADLRQWLDFDLDWTQVHSVTAFGATYEPKQDNTGLLLVHTSMEVVKGLETAIERNTPALRPEKIEAGPTPLYRVNHDSYIWAGPGGQFLVGKSREAVEHARAAFTGREPNLTGTKLLETYRPAANAFFFVGLAEDFGRKASLPPKAAVLKQAEGGRLGVGERGDKVFATLALRTTTPEVAQQIQQVVQGLVALATLSQEQNPQLQELARGARVTAADRWVTIGIEVPVARAIEKIDGID